MIVTLVRKPLEGSVITNSVAWGSAGVNVDGCRIGSPEVLTGGGGKLWSHYRDSTEERASPQVNAGLGRFPANLIMTHLAGCTQGGLVRQRGVQIAAGSVGFGHDREDGYVTGKGRQYMPDVVTSSWQCLDGCPVKGLGKQSGERRSTMTGRADPLGVYINPGKSDPNVSMFGVGGGGVYADTGGASRFYKNLKL